jgi:putative ABC transport system permease protein
MTLTIAFISVFVFLAVSLTFRDRLILTSKDDTNIYAINILEADRKKVQKEFPNDNLFSVLRARISTVNSKPLSEHVAGKGPDREFTREFSLTTNPLLDIPMARGERVIDERSVTVDEDFAERLWVDIWDRIGFLIAGRNFELEVTGIREAWERGFRPFFYFQVSDKAFAWAPKTYFMATRTDNVESFKSRMLAATGPHVTFVDVGSILVLVQSIANKILSVLGLFLAFVSTFAVLAVATLFWSLESVSRLKSRLYGLFGATKVSVARSMRTSSMVLMGLCLVLTLSIGTGTFFFVLGKMTFLSFSPAVFGFSVFVILMLWAVLAAFLTRRLESYSSTR